MDGAPGQGTRTWAVHAAPPEPERALSLRPGAPSDLARPMPRGSPRRGAGPAYVEREFRRYLECGILAHGFARARCGQCGHDFLIAFSCKGRGVCPSCNTQRMAATAAHLTDHVLPDLPLRQWVLAVPKRVR